MVEDLSAQEAELVKLKQAILDAKAQNADAAGRLKLEQHRLEEILRSSEEAKKTVVVKIEAHKLDLQNFTDAHEKALKSFERDKETSKADLGKRNG